MLLHMQVCMCMCACVTHGKTLFFHIHVECICGNKCSIQLNRSKWKFNEVVASMLKFYAEKVCVHTYNAFIAMECIVSYLVLRSIAYHGKDPAVYILISTQVFDAIQPLEKNFPTHCPRTPPTSMYIVIQATVFQQLNAHGHISTHAQLDAQGET